MIPFHASAPIQALKIEPLPFRPCDGCNKVKDEILSREPWSIRFLCYDCRKGR